MSSKTPAPEGRPPLEVVAGILLREGRVLVARRAEGKSNGGLWEFPGGKVEPGETHASALARELGEELGIEVQVGAHVLTVEHRYPTFDIRLHAYRCDLSRGEPVALEHSEVRYVEPETLDALAFAPANIPIARAVGTSIAGGAPWRA